MQRFNLRLYADDIDLIRWLRDIPEGGRNQALKDMLRLGIQASERGSLNSDAIQQVVREEMAQTSSTLDQQAVRQAVQEALRASREEGGSRDFTLGDIRQVVSAALVEELDRRQIDSLEGEQVREAEEDDEEQEGIDELVKRLSDAAMQPGMGA